MTFDLCSFSILQDSDAYSIVGTSPALFYEQEVSKSYRKNIPLRCSTMAASSIHRASERHFYWAHVLTLTVYNYGGAFGFVPGSTPFFSLSSYSVAVGNFSIML